MSVVKLPWWVGYPGSLGLGGMTAFAGSVLSPAQQVIGFLLSALVFAWGVVATGWHFWPKGWWGRHVAWRLRRRLPVAVTVAPLVPTPPEPTVAVPDITQKIARVHVLRTWIPKIEDRLKEGKVEYEAWLDFPREKKVFGLGLQSGNHRHFKQRYEGLLSSLNNTLIWREAAADIVTPPPVDPAALMGKPAPHEQFIMNVAGDAPDPDRGFVFRGWVQELAQRIKAWEDGIKALKGELNRLEAEIANASRKSS